MTAKAPVTPDPAPAPWAHLPEADQEAIELALAYALVAWIDREVAAMTANQTQAQMGDAGDLAPGVSTLPR